MFSAERVIIKYSTKQIEISSVRFFEKARPRSDCRIVRTRIGVGTSQPRITTATSLDERRLRAAKIKVREHVGELFGDYISSWRLVLQSFRFREKEVEIMKASNTRRDFLRTAAVVGTGRALSGCRGGNLANSEGQKKNEPSAQPEENKLGGEVTATEDLMREHGILRPGFAGLQCGGSQASGESLHDFPRCASEDRKTVPRIW